MATYARTQYGVWIVALVSLLAGGVIVFIQTSGDSRTVPAFWVVAAVWTVIVSLFGRLTVEVNDKEIRLAFGVGWVRKRIPLDSVAAVATVRNRWWYGFGLRYTPRGWLWNIQGLDAVELEYTSGSHFRIGTNDPESLQHAIEGRLGQ